MTRASLLHILDNLGGISETEVQELEQLAATFPYCQTAHLLLAKAAHDRGSMLAAQRLRRAATFAVDRQQLRALIELPAPLPPTEAPAPAAEEQLQVAPLAPLAITTQPSVDVIAAEPEAVQNVQIDSFEIAAPDTQSIDSVTSIEEVDSKEENASTNNEVEPEVIEADEASTESISSEVLLLDDASETPAQAEPAEPTQFAASHEANGHVLEELSEPILVAYSPIEEVTLEHSVEVEAVVSTSAEPESDVVEPIAEPFVLAADTAGASVDSEPETVQETEEELPLAPPPIRPPAEVGSSRFEFGLAQTLPIPTYNLFEVEKTVAKQTAVIPPFWADEEVGYAPGLGSRLGFCLQTQDEYTLDLPPSAFFEPDALLLQHLKQHQPVPPPVPTSIDLIDKFLRSKPRFRAPLPLPPTTEAQADLSVRSTLAEPNLASESLARILARQGKITKAIEIYERLIVRQPEKKAYFADQIQQLQTFE